MTSSSYFFFFQLGARQRTAQFDPKSPGATRPIGSKTGSNAPSDRGNTLGDGLRCFFTFLDTLPAPSKTDKMPCWKRCRAACCAESGGKKMLMLMASGSSGHLLHSMVKTNSSRARAVVHTHTHTLSRRNQENPKTPKKEWLVRGKTSTRMN